MTDAQIKAKELIDKFTYEICSCNGLSQSESTFNCAKESALICVYEILESYSTKNLIYPNEYKFWQQVKQEITNYK